MSAGSGMEGASVYYEHPLGTNSDGSLSPLHMKCVLNLIVLSSAFHLTRLS